MSARPLFLGGARRPDFASTDGHTEPAVAEIPGVRVLGEDGSRLDLHRVTAANDWLSDAELADLTAEQREEARRAETRARLAAVREEFRITRRQWLVWLFFALLGLSSPAWLPDSGYGWSLASLWESTP